MKSLLKTNILMTDLLELGPVTGFRATHTQVGSFSGEYAFVNNFDRFETSDKYYDNKTGYVRVHVTNCTTFNNRDDWRYTNSLPQFNGINGNPAVSIHLIKLTPDEGTNLDFLSTTTSGYYTGSWLINTNNATIIKRAQFNVVHRGNNVYLVPNLTADEFNHLICKGGNCHIMNFNLDSAFTGYIEAIPINPLASTIKNFNTRENVVKWLKSLPKTTGFTLTLGSTLLAKLTDEDKKIATDKGWTLA